MATLILPAPEQTSFLTRNTIVERVDCQLLETLLASDFLLLEWNSNDCWFVNTLKQAYQNEKKQISDYTQAYNPECDGVIVTYNSAKHYYGRLFVRRSLGFTNFRRPVRHTVANYYYDFDIQNCQPVLLMHLLVSYGLPCPPALENYVANREDIIKMHMEAWNIKPEDKWLVKQLFIRLFFMGGYDRYREDMKQYDYNLPTYATGFVTSLQASLLDVAKNIRAVNPDLYRVACNKRKETNDRNPNHILKTFMALYLQTAERNVVESVMEHLHNTTDLMKRKEHPMYVYTSYEYDGFKLLRENVDNYEGGKEAVCLLIEKITREITNLPLKWKVKEMDEAYDLSTVEIPDVNERLQFKKDMEIAMVSHRHIAEIIKNRYSATKYIYELSDKQWYTYDTYTDKWEASDFFLQRDFIKIIDSLFNHPLYMKDEKYAMTYTKFLAKSGSSSYMAGVEKMARIVMYKGKVEFDVDTDLINFNNGIYDIRTGEFRKRTMEDFVTMSTGYDYAPLNSEDIEFQEEVMTVLKQIHPVEEDLKLNLLIMASGLSGRAIEKFFVFNGCGRNGKSLLHSALKILLGDYFVIANISILTEDMRKRSSSEANSAIAALDKIRYIVFREPAKNIPIQNAPMKDLTGGGELVARKLFKEQKSVRMDGTFALECNSKPAFAETCEEAEAERVVDYHFQSHFTSDPVKLEKAAREGKHVYPLRTELKERSWWIKRRNAFLHILLDNLKVLHENDYNIAKFIPEHVKVRSKQYCESSILVVQLFHELFYIPVEGEEAPYAGWDEDMTVARAVQYIRTSENFLSQPASKRYARDGQPNAMKECLELHCEERLDVLYTSHKQKFIRGFRKKYEVAEVATDQESSSEFDMLSETSTDIL